MHTSIVRGSAAVILSFMLCTQSIGLSIAVAQETLDDTGTSSASSTASTETTATESETTKSETSSESSESSSSENSSNSASVASTTHDVLEIHATSTGGSESIEDIVQSVSSSTAGFVDIFGTSTPSSTGAAFTEDDANAGSGGAGANTVVSTSTPPGSASSTPWDTASSTQVIDTGRALAIANILNLLNTTFVNSEGHIIFGNFMGTTTDVDLRDGSLFGACAADGCTGLQGVELNMIKDAYVLNSIILSANSGGNAITNASSSAAILSGDAFAGLNLVNIANTTFANAVYVLAALNAFRGVDGDIIFPSLYAFLQNSQTAVPIDSITQSNHAEVSNDVSAHASSGDNTMENVDGPQYTQTGNAQAYTNIFNQLNSLLAGNGIAILLRITGEFNGEIWGLPDGVSVQRTPMGLYISGSGGTGAPQGPGLGLAGTSTARIDNDVSVEATSGGNAVRNASSSALISTGNAFAGANIINIANQTVIGKNWMLAVFNIFGDLNGNISFGRPDLWVGARVDAPGLLQNGSQLRYTITVKNRGDSPVNNVMLTETFDDVHLEFEEANREHTRKGSTITFPLGTLMPGQHIEVAYTAVVHDTARGTAITSESRVAGHETDNDIADNTDRTTVRTYSGASGGGGGSFSTPLSSTLSHASNTAPQPTTVTVQRVSDTMQASPLSPGVTQTIVIKNTGTHRARNVVFHDVLRDPSGAIVHGEEWLIETMEPHEELLITYEFRFADHAPKGRYTLESEVLGTNVTRTIAQNGTIDFVDADVPVIQQPAPVLPPDIRNIIESLPAFPSVPNAGSVFRVSAEESLTATTSDSAQIGHVEPGSLVAAAAGADDDMTMIYTLLAALFMILAVAYRALRPRIV